MQAAHELSAELIEELRGILEGQYERPVNNIEAAAIGRWLIGFYGKLADGIQESDYIQSYKHE